MWTISCTHWIVKFSYGKVCSSHLQGPTLYLWSCIPLPTFLVFICPLWKTVWILTTLLLCCLWYHQCHIIYTSIRATLNINNCCSLLYPRQNNIHDSRNPWSFPNETPHDCSKGCTKLALLLHLVPDSEQSSLHVTNVFLLTGPVTLQVCILTMYIFQFSVQIGHC